MAHDSIKMARNPDLLLVVTKGDDVRRFEVNSAILRHASQVFHTMLGPDFAEGQALARNHQTRCEVEIEDDDPTCMEIILNCIHFQHRNLPERIGSNDIANLATLVDKYLLQETMKLVLEDWMIPKEADDLHQFLQAAVTLKHAKSFRETTKLMILHQTTSYIGVMPSEADPRTYSFIYKIDCKRDGYRGTLLRNLYAVAEETCVDYPCSEARYLTKMFLTRILKLDQDTKSLRLISLSDAFVQAPKVLEVDVPEYIKCHKTHGRYTHPVATDIQITHALEQVKVEGLCIGCMEREYEGEQGGACEYGHNDPV